MNTFKFIHISDVHLGKTNNYNMEDDRFEDFVKVFIETVEYAVSKNVHAFLIAGDFFDSPECDPRTIKHAQAGLEILKQNDILTFAIEGNHDIDRQNTKKLTWLEYFSEKRLLILLKPNINLDKEKKYLELLPFDKKENKGSIYKYNCFNIIGLGYPGSNADEKIENMALQIPEDENNILLLHAIVSGFPSICYGRIEKESIEALTKKSIYIALGHGHTNYNVNDIAYNGGSLEYIRETDFKNSDRGFHYVEVNYDDNDKYLNKTVEHIKTHKRPSYTFEINLDNDFNENNIFDIIENEYSQIDNIKHDDRKPIFRIILKGKISSEYQYQLPLNKIRRKCKEKYNTHFTFIDINRLSFDSLSNDYKMKMQTNRNEHIISSFEEVLKKRKISVNNEKKLAQLLNEWMNSDSFNDKENYEEYEKQLSELLK